MSAGSFRNNKEHELGRHTGFSQKIRMWRDLFSKSGSVKGKVTEAKPNEPFHDDRSEITESLYKQNRELFVKNKTLSLLQQLYEISILELVPKKLAERISGTIQQAFDFELVGIFLFDDKQMVLTPLHMARSVRVSDELFKSLGSIKNIKISDLGAENVFVKAMGQKTALHQDEFDLVWGPGLGTKVSTNIKTTIVQPLVIRDKVVGAITLCLDKRYGELMQFEHESIRSFVNVIAIALDKAILYQDLEHKNVELNALNVQKTEFISVASHQLRGPLTAIKGYASLVLEGDFGEISVPVREAIETMFKSTQALVVIVGDYLDVSRIEQGKMRYDFSDFDIQPFIASIINEFQPNVKVSGLSLTFNTKKGDYFIHADQGKVKQVISNLLDNAIKYTPRGKIEVTVLRTPSDKIQVIFKDTGVGIPADVMPKLFDKFSRAPGASQTNITGTGLGLYVAKKMMEAHRGRVWAESEGKDKGSTFILELDALHKTPNALNTKLETAVEKFDSEMESNS